MKVKSQYHTHALLCYLYISHPLLCFFTSFICIHFSIFYTSISNMHSNIDLRFLVPLSVNFFRQFLPSITRGLWDSVGYYLIMWETALPILIFFILFLAVSIKLPLSLSLSTRPIRLQLGDLYFSVLLALTMLGSILLPTALFCSVYIVCSCIFMASWPRSLVQSFRQWLLSLPAFVVTPDPAGLYSVLVLY